MEIYRRKREKRGANGLNAVTGNLFATVQDAQSTQTRLLGGLCLRTKLCREGPTGYGCPSRVWPLIRTVAQPARQYREDLAPSGIVVQHVAGAGDRDPGDEASPDALLRDQSSQAWLGCLSIPRSGQGSKLPGKGFTGAGTLRRGMLELVRSKHGREGWNPASVLDLGVQLKVVVSVRISLKPCSTLLMWEINSLLTFMT